MTELPSSAWIGLPLIFVVQRQKALTHYQWLPVPTMQRIVLIPRLSLPGSLQCRAEMQTLVAIETPPSHAVLILPNPRASSIVCRTTSGGAYTTHTCQCKSCTRKPGTR